MKKTVAMTMVMLMLAQCIAGVAIDVNPSGEMLSFSAVQNSATNASIDFGATDASNGITIQAAQQASYTVKTVLGTEGKAFSSFDNLYKLYVDPDKIKSNDIYCTVRWFDPNTAEMAANNYFVKLKYRNDSNEVITTATFPMRKLTNKWVDYSFRITNADFTKSLDTGCNLQISVWMPEGGIDYDADTAIDYYGILVDSVSIVDASNPPPMTFYAGNTAANGFSNGMALAINTTTLDMYTKEGITGFAGKTAISNRNIKFTVDPERVNYAKSFYLTVSFWDPTGSESHTFACQYPQGGTGNRWATAPTVTSKNVGKWVEFRMLIKNDILDWSADNPALPRQINLYLNNSASYTDSEGKLYNGMIFSSVKIEKTESDNIAAYEFGYGVGAGMTKGSDWTGKAVYANGVYGAGGSTSSDRHKTVNVDTSKFNASRNLYAKITWFDEANNTADPTSLWWRLRWTSTDPHPSYSTMYFQDGEYIRREKTGQWKQTLIRINNADLTKLTGGMAEGTKNYNLNIYGASDTNTIDSNVYGSALIREIVVYQGPELIIDKAVFTADGDTNAKTVINGGDDITATVNLYRGAAAASRDITVIAAVYNSEKELIDIVAEKQMVAPNDKKTYTLDFQALPDTITGYKIVFMLWDSLEGMRPITNNSIYQ